MLEVSIRNRNGCSVSKGMRGQWSNDYGKHQMSTPPRARERRQRQYGLTMLLQRERRVKSTHKCLSYPSTTARHCTTVVYNL